MPQVDLISGSRRVTVTGDEGDTLKVVVATACRLWPLTAVPGRPTDLPGTVAGFAAEHAGEANTRATTDADPHRTGWIGER